MFSYIFQRMIPTYTICVALSLLWNTSASEIQAFDREPTDQTAVIGSRVTLPCRVTNRRGILQWTKDDFGLGTTRKLEGYERYTMEGSDDEDDFSLRINPVKLEDDATYQCQVSPYKTQPQLRSRLARLTVLIPPEVPQIIQGKKLETTAGKKITLECESRGGKPPAEITWLDGDGSAQESDCKTVYLSDGKRANRMCILLFTADESHHDKNMTCQAHNGAISDPMSTRIHLTVKYPPKITLEVDSQRIEEYDEVRFICSGVGNPNDLVFKWYKDDEKVIGDHVTEYVIPSVSREYNDSNITCEVTNSVGTSRASHRLNIKYGPRFKNPPENVVSELGGHALLNCEVDGNPRPEIVWTHRNSRKVLSTSSSYNVTRISYQSAGQYQCRASVAGFKEISAEVVILIKEPPKVVSPPIQYGYIGEVTFLECVVISVPPPYQVLWERDDVVVNLDDPRYDMTQEETVDGVRNTLVIQSAGERDFGTYNCTVRNDYGVDFLSIVLRPRRSFSLLLIIAGAIGGILAILIATLLILACQRRKTTRRKEHASSINNLTSTLASSDKKSGFTSSGDNSSRTERYANSTVGRDSDWDESDMLMTASQTSEFLDYREQATKQYVSNNNSYVPYTTYRKPPPPPPHRHVPLVSQTDHEYFATSDGDHLRASTIYPQVPNTASSQYNPSTSLITRKTNFGTHV